MKLDLDGSCGPSFRSHPSRVRGLKPRPGPGWRGTCRTPSRVRGLKHVLAFYQDAIRGRTLHGCVIETRRPSGARWRGLSHPSRVRGLKPFGVKRACCMSMSHPSRVRGLKLEISYHRPEHGRRTLHGCGLKLGVHLHPNGVLVAPFTGAWIETAQGCEKNDGNNVAPFTGAWIETRPGPWRSWSGCRAPFTGAWIET